MVLTFFHDPGHLLEAKTGTQQDLKPTPSFLSIPGILYIYTPYTVMTKDMALLLVDTKIFERSKYFC